jgi:hypothetical protein
MTPDQVIALAEQAGIGFQSHTPRPGRVIVSTRGSQRLDAMIRFAALVAAAEREACAVACEDVQKGNEDNGAWLWEAKNCAAAIRARGTP